MKIADSLNRGIWDLVVVAILIQVASSRYSLLTLWWSIVNYLLLLGKLVFSFENLLWRFIIFQGIAVFKYQRKL